MIEINNLVFDYPNLRAIDNVSYTLKDSTITAIVGPNGAGKTTLLKCIAALQKPLSGSILIDGEDIIDNPIIAKSKVGYLQDFFGLYDDLTVRQSLTYFAKAHLMPLDLIPSKVEEVASDLNLYDKLDAQSENLSRGMRQRLAIGQTIIFEPKYLLLDEPASGLDPEARISLANLFLELNKKGITMLVSSHILAELDQYASELIIMQEGKILESERNVNEFSKQKIVLSVDYSINNINELLDNYSKITSYTIENNMITLDFDGDNSEHSLLLKYLIDNQVIIKEFSVKKENIQDKYLNILKSI